MKNEWEKLCKELAEKLVQQTLDVLKRKITEAEVPIPVGEKKDYGSN